jgi:hypothetical protein
MNGSKRISQKRNNKTCQVSFIVLIAVSFSLLACFSPLHIRSGNTPEEMFEALIQSPMPEEIGNLQGTGDTWQGHNIYLRFHAPSVFVENYTESKFKQATCEDILHRFELPSPDYDIFEPPWSPQSVGQANCYQSLEWIGVSWIGEQYFLHDEAAGLIYFHGIGP